MLLGVDIGNSNVVLGGIGETEIFFTERMRTDPNASLDFYTEKVQKVLETHADCTFTGAILTSVVPALSPILRQAVERVTGLCVMEVSHQMRTDLEIHMDHPERVGSDLLVAAVAAVAEYPKPMLIFDMGTATTVTAIDAQGHYIGGMILAGVQLSLNALSSGTAQLPTVLPAPTEKMLEKNTIACMQSGAVYGHAAMVDGILERAEKEMGQPLFALVTGGISRIITPLCKRELTYDPDLLLKGLRILYHKNQGGDTKC